METQGPLQRHVGLVDPAPLSNRSRPYVPAQGCRSLSPCPQQSHLLAHSPGSLQAAAHRWVVGPGTQRASALPTGSAALGAEQQATRVCRRPEATSREPPGASQTGSCLWPCPGPRVASSSQHLSPGAVCRLSPGPSPSRLAWRCPGPTGPGGGWGPVRARTREPDYADPRCLQAPSLIPGSGSPTRPPPAPAALTPRPGAPSGQGVAFFPPPRCARTLASLSGARHLPGGSLLTRLPGRPCVRVWPLAPWGPEKQNPCLPPYFPFFSSFCLRMKRAVLCHPQEEPQICQATGKDVPSFPGRRMEPLIIIIIKSLGFMEALGL
ncbi:uncharacterized protein LOC113198612 [Urocitellus parryii]